MRVVCSVHCEVEMYYLEIIIGSKPQQKNTLFSYFSKNKKIHLENVEVSIKIKKAII